MAPKSKAMKAAKRTMSKSAIAEVLMGEYKLNKTQVNAWLDSLVRLAAKELRSLGKFTIPGLCIIKMREKPATKAGKKVMFGKEIVVKAKPAKMVVKAFPVATLKNSVT